MSSTSRTSPAFALSATPFLRTSTTSPLCTSRSRAPVRHARTSCRPRMQTEADDSSKLVDIPESTPTSASEADASTPATSASEILKTLREDSAADNTPSKRTMLGVYRDVDGRSNVWAVEPKEETDTSPQLSKTTLIAAAAAFIVIALLVLPLLPFTNPDQL